MESGGLVMIHNHAFYSSHTKLQHKLGTNRVGLLRLGSNFKRDIFNSSSPPAASVSGSGADFSEQLLGVKPKKKGNEISGIDQDELVDPSVLADSDSCFCEFNNVKIHHKISEAESPTQNATLDQGTSQITKYFPMILLHGFGASLFSWHRVMKQLAQIAGSKVLAFDRPAFGLTSRMSLQEHVLNNGKDTKPLNPYSMIFSVLATLHLIDFLAAEKAILVGHSAGSLVAVNAYFEAPERVAALILVAPAIIAPLIERKKYKQKKSAATQTQIKENSSKFAVNSNPFIGIYSILSKFLKYILQAIVNLVIGMKNLINSLYKKALSALLRSALAVMLVRFLINKFGITAVKNSWYDQNQVTEHILDGYTKPLKVKGWDTALAEYVAAMFSEFSSELKPLTANRLDEISCPVLIITGDSDRLVPSWNSVRLARAIPGSSLEIIEKCGHLPHEEKPEEFLLIIEKFLRSVLGGSNKPCI